MTATPVEDMAPREAPPAPGPVSPVPVCVVVPTRNEGDNVAPLVHRVRQALRGRPTEIIFVDDSDDDTPDIVRTVAARAGLRVRVLHRAPHDRAGGLGGAVTAGIRATDAPWVIVMDGDLQHPPETLPLLIEHGVARDLDVVVASRYRPDGDAGGLASPYRDVVSAGSSHLVRLAFPRRLAGVTDPMSGFFAVRVASVALDELRPDGFKILLEVLGRSPGLRVGEVPFRFAAREHGESNASLREGGRFLRHLLRLRLTLPERARRLGRFALVGASGFVVNLGVLHLLIGLPVPTTGVVHDAVWAAVAAQVALVWNFVLTERCVFAGQDRAERWGTRLLVFWALGTLALLLQLPLAVAVQVTAGVGYTMATAVALASLLVLRFGVLDRYLYGRHPAAVAR